MAGWQDAPLAETPPASGAWQQAPLQYQIDWTRPVAEVRAQIAQLPEEERQEALRQWADAYVAQERAQATTTLPSDVVRAVARGTVVGPWLDEANALTAAGLHRLTGGWAGAPYDEAVAYQRAQDRATDRERPVTAGASQVVGALAGGGAAYRAARHVGLPILLAGSLPRMMGVGAGVGAVQAATYAGGVSEGDVWERASAALRAAPAGAVIGALVPPVLRSGPLLPRITAAGTIGGGLGYAYGDGDASLAAGAAGAAGALPPAARAVGGTARALLDYAGPALARAQASLGGIPRRLGISASADGAVPGTAGSRAAAEEMAANAAVRGGVTGEQLRAGLDPETMRFWSSGRAEDARVLADLNPAMQRLASSAGRLHPEAGTLMAEITRARQMGVIPDNPAGQAAVAAAGIPTRGAMERAGRGDRPTGQFQRLRDAFRRAMLIEDDAFHGHAGTGRQTEAAILERARREADDLYTAAYRAGAAADIPAALQPVFARWEARLANEAEPVQTLVRRIMAAIGRSRSLEQFDRNKRYLLDDRIDNLLNSSVGRSRETARVLTQLKDELMEAIDNIPTAGALYRTARDAFSSQMSLRDALRAGRSAFREDSEVGVEMFRALQTEGERKLFRLGLLDSFTDRAAAMGRGHDRLSLFDNPRIREILSEIIPRSRRGGAEFADRPQRFGRYLDAEGRMIQTRAEVHGNSKTAQRMADDEAYQALSSFTELWSNSGSLTAAATEVAGRWIRQNFGMQADTAAELARMLFTADPVQRARNLEAIIARMGANRAEQLARFLERYQMALTGGAARTVPAMGGTDG